MMSKQARERINETRLQLWQTLLGISEDRIKAIECCSIDLSKNVKDQSNEMLTDNIEKTGEENQVPEKQNRNNSN